LTPLPDTRHPAPDTRYPLRSLTLLESVAALKG
jgi:hypothetical protein